MANIKLSEIPNAPQSVANYTMNPQYTGDQVGGEAKAEINKGFQGLMQDPQNAGIVGRAYAAAGGDITSGGANFASGMLYNAKAKDKAAEAEGFQTYYGNKTKIEDEYYSRINDPNNPIPIEARPAIWLDVTQKGTRFLEGMPPEQQHAYGMEATKDFYAGVTASSNEVHALKKQEYATNQLTAYQTAMTGKDWANARIAVATGVKTGAFSPEDGARFETNIRTNEQFHGLLDKMYADKTGTLFKSVMATGEGGGTMKDAPDVSSENLVKLGKAGEAIYNQDLWSNNVEQFKAQIDSKEIIDPNQLKGNKLFDSMPEPQKAAVLARLTNNRAGTKEGAAYAAGGQSLVNTYPKDPNNKSNELLANKTWILGNVPEPAASAQIDAIDKKYAEMVGNGGNLKPETSVMTNAAQQLDAIFDTGFYGGKKFSEIAKDIKKGTAKAADVQTYLQISALKDSVMQKVRASGAQTDADAQKVYEKELRTIRATDKNPPTDGMLWWKKTAPIPSAKLSSLPEGVTPVANGKVTNYWPSEVKGDDGIIGNHDNALVAGDMGLSPDMEAEIKAKGVKKGTPVRLYVQDNDGKIITHDTKYNDSTRQDKDSIAKGKDPLRGRFDLWVKNKGESDDGAHLLDGKRVVGYKVLNKNA
jgi:hypothetical protein